MTEPTPSHGPIVRAVGPYLSYQPGDRNRQYGLGRHLNHDPQSRAFAFEPREQAPRRPVRHYRQVPIFDQGGLGSCEPNAGLGLLGTEPYFSALQVGGLLSADRGSIVLPETVAGNRYWPSDRIPFTEEGAVGLYHEVTENDPFDGTYPPDDTGSDGLSMAKVFRALGIIPSYRHTFSLNAMLAALQEYPLLMGTDWHADMFNPAPRTGIIAATGQVVGGHAWIADEFVPAGSIASGWDPLTQAPTPVDLVGGVTSWGTGFGLLGRFYLSVPDVAGLLAQRGDVIVPTPPKPAKPAPPPPAPIGPSGQQVADAVRKALQDLGL